MRLCTLLLCLAASLAGRADTFTVTNTASSGPGSLARAIQDAYGYSGGPTNLIAFNIPGPGVHAIIPPPDGLPTLGQAILDGYTQPGAQPNTLTNGDNAVLLIEVRGQLSLFGNCTVRGLAIGHFAGAGIYLQGDCLVEGNFLGTDPSGTAAHRNGRCGILINDSLANTIGGVAAGSRNLIAANGAAGIGLAGGHAGQNVIQGNWTASTALAPGPWAMA